MSRRKPLPVEPVETIIDSLAHDGRGVAHVEGKAVFINNALPGEHVRFRYTARQRRYDEGNVVELLSTSPQRVQPRCGHYGICGGCSLQHLSVSGQLEAKQQILIDALQRIGKVSPVEYLPPLQADVWAYRSKARLGVRYVANKSRVLVGFREKHSSYITDMLRCEVLHPAVGEKISALSELIEGLSAKAEIPQIEVAIAEEAVCLIFRVLSALNTEDIQLLRSFSHAQGFEIMLQPGGADSVFPLDENLAPLQYRLDDNHLVFSFQPMDFTQVNPSLNRKMVKLALELLAPAPHETILDLFCGLGNFSLPLARLSRHVVGVEGEAGMVDRAYANAKQNDLGNLEFFTCDLFREISEERWMHRSYQKVLLDPPRAGAEALMAPIARRIQPEKIIYVSCNPATLARDAGLLVRQYGYQLAQVGIMDMFPHTSHVECIALFVPN